jgi:hypothetical protein
MERPHVRVFTLREGVSEQRRYVVPLGLPPH